MNIVRCKGYSKYLGRDMEYKVYGHKGKPVLVFPTASGRFSQYEDFGMIETITGFIDAGKIQVWTCDDVDSETFLADWGFPADRILRHELYDKYITKELVPSILRESRDNNGGIDQKILTTGCSMGGYHSANFFFRHPQVFDTLISLSGLFSASFFFGDYMDKNVYYNSPINYLPDLTDETYLRLYRQSRIIICCGRGAYEERMIEDSLKMREILSKKKIPAWVDIWGTDVNHHWDWWKKQIVYFLDKCVNHGDDLRNT